VYDTNIAIILNKKSEFICELHDASSFENYWKGEIAIGRICMASDKLS